VPPAGFLPAAGFAGWSQADREAAIAVTELPTARDTLIAELSPARLAERGSTVVYARREGAGWWIRLHEEPWTGPVERWMVVLGDDTATALVIATIPSGDEAFSATIEAALRTAEFDPAAAGSPFDGLRFRVTEAEGLRIAARSHALVLLTEGGVVGKTQGAPMLTVGSYEAPGEPSDWYAFATGHLKDLPHVTALGEVTGVPHVLDDGTLAYELTTDGLATSDARPMHIYQLAAARDGLRVIVSGLVEQTNSERWLAAFRAVGRSLVLDSR
jgi:hypothetical protein